ncbi:hypothetical protein NDU88_003749 [Pleurodeles waltl]|uniref:Uncharacterized protein n=1 Tax=Pleurodeles waltl TaxID=8319 RepID=A0AAV7LJG2_PLEWA|nr:hypothetical protein NDU88_003749 [Pleurodeles waltl]
MVLYPAKLKVIHEDRSHFFMSPEETWYWLEIRGGDCIPARHPGRTHSEPHWVNRSGAVLRKRIMLRKQLSPGERVVVRPDDSLDLETQKMEQEEARALVESVTSAAALSASSDRQDSPSPLPDDTEEP